MPPACRRRPRSADYPVLDPSSLPYPINARRRGGPPGAAMTLDEAVSYTRRVLPSTGQAPLAKETEPRPTEVRRPETSVQPDDGPTVRTFLMTDVVGSTRATRLDSMAMRAFMDRHDEALMGVVADAGGRTFKHTGDGVCAVFDDPADAVAAAVAGQRALLGFGAEVRIGIDIGVAHRRGPEYFGLTLNRCSRVMGRAQGGQVLVTLAIEQLLRDAMPSGLSLIDLGTLTLRDFGDDQRLFQVAAEGLPAGVSAIAARLGNGSPPISPVIAGPNADVVQELVVGTVGSLSRCDRSGPQPAPSSGPGSLPNAGTSGAGERRRPDRSTVLCFRVRFGGTGQGKRNESSYEGRLGTSGVHAVPPAR